MLSTVLSTLLSIVMTVLLAAWLRSSSLGPHFDACFAEAGLSLQYGLAIYEALNRSDFFLDRA